MIVCNLLSSSSGNCSYIKTNNYQILIDAGGNKKYLKEKLNDLDTSFENIDYVFLTHTHSDHIAALKDVLKESSATLVLTPKMLNDLTNLKDYPNILLYDDSPIIDNLDISAYKMSHDSSDIRAFVINDNNTSLVYITDTGYINQRYLKIFANKTIYFIESNHDIEKLENGPYPSWLKQRVLSDVGHLSNNFCGMYLEKMIGDNTKEILLLHLSEKNNDPELALETVKKYVKDKEINLSYKNDKSKVFEL